MKWILLIFLIAPLGQAENSHSAPRNIAASAQDYYSPQASSAAGQVYYGGNSQYAPAPAQQTPNFFYNYYPNYLQKQDAGITDLFGLGGDGGGDGSDIGGALGGTLGAIAIGVGLKVLKKLGVAAIFTFIFVVIPLLIVPLILAIAAIIVSAMDSAGESANKIMEMIKGRQTKRALEVFEHFFKSEECVERISCAIGKRAYERSSFLSGLKKSEQASQGEGTESEDSKGETIDEKRNNTTFFTKISRAFRSDDCRVYKCSITNYFG